MYTIMIEKSGFAIYIKTKAIYELDNTYESLNWTRKESTIGVTNLNASLSFVFFDWFTETCRRCRKIRHNEMYKHF